MYKSENSGALSAVISKFINITTSFVLVASTTLFGLALNAVDVDAAGTHVITGTNVTGYNVKGEWWFNRDASSSTPYEFNLNEQQIGEGALYVLPISSNPSDKFIAEYFIKEKVSDITSFSYDFLIGDGGDASNANEFYLNAYVNFANDSNYGDCVYNIVPLTAAGWTTNTFDPEASYDVRTRGSAPETCPASPSDLPETSYVRMFAINLGDTADPDAGLDGYFDNVVVNSANDMNIYDFEPTRLAAPTLLVPAHNSVVNNDSGTLQDWTNVTGATKYMYESYSDEALTDLVYTTFRTPSNRTIGTNATDLEFFWRVAAVDSNNVRGLWSDTFKLTLDGTDPIVNITSHSNDDVVQGDVDVRGSYTDENPDSRRLAIRNLTNNSIIFNSGFKNVSANFTDELLETWDSTSVEDGRYRLNLAGRDQANNRSSTIVNIEVDNPPASPTGLTIFQSNNTTGEELTCSALTNNGLITVDWADNTEDDIDYYWYGISNATRTVEKFRKVEAEDGSSYTGNVTPGNGPYSYTVIAVDAAGNESEKATCGEFNLDIEDPIAELTNLNDGDFISATKTIKGSVTDDNPWRYYSVARKAGTNTVVAGPGTVYEDESFTDKVLFELNTTLLEDGADYDVFLAARDLADNRGPASEDVKTVTVDNSAPVISVTTPVTGTSYNGFITVEGSAIDAGVGTASVQVTIFDSSGDDVFSEPATYNSVDNTWTLEVDSQLEALGDGEYTFVFTAIDALMNVSEEEVVEVTIDNSAPQSTFTPASVVDDSSPELNGTTNDADATIEVTVDEETYTATNNGDGTWTLAAGIINDLDDGTYDVTVNSTDSLGNSESVTFARSLEISTTPTPAPRSTTTTSPSTTSNPVALASAPVVQTATITADADGEVAGETTDAEDDDNGEVLQATDDSSDTESDETEGSNQDDDCARFLGVCWYFWIIPAGILAVVGYNYYAGRKEQ